MEVRWGWCYGAEGVAAAGDDYDYVHDDDRADDAPDAGGDGHWKDADVDPEDDVEDGQQHAGDPDDDQVASSVLNVCHPLAEGGASPASSGS